MPDRVDNAETLLQEPEKMTDNTGEDICCFGMVRCNVSDILVFLLDSSLTQSARRQLKHLTN